MNVSYINALHLFYQRSVHVWQSAIVRRVPDTCRLTAKDQSNEQGHVKQELVQISSTSGCSPWWEGVSLYGKDFGELLPDVELFIFIDTN